MEDHHQHHHHQHLLQPSISYESPQSSSNLHSSLSQYGDESSVNVDLDHRVSVYVDLPTPLSPCTNSITIELSSPQSPQSTQAQQSDKRNITLNDLRSKFHLPLKMAAMELSLSMSQLKSLKKKFGINHWPHRKIQKEEKRIAPFKASLRDDTLSKKMIDKIEDRIAQHNQRLLAIYDNSVLCSDFSNKRREKDRVEDDDDSDDKPDDEISGDYMLPRLMDESNPLSSSKLPLPCVNIVDKDVLGGELDDDVDSNAADDSVLIPPLHSRKKRRKHEMLEEMGMSLLEPSLDLFDCPFVLVSFLPHAHASETV